jgi:hypothetical protein
MFVPYALAGGMALALLALFCEIGNYLKWSGLRKWVGGLTVLAGTMGVVPQIASEFSQLAVAAVCSCLVLALSARGYQEVTRTSNESIQPIEQHVHRMEELQAIEETHTFEELQVVDEPVVDSAAPVADESQIHTQTHPAEAQSAPEIDAEWLNGQIAAGYAAKAAGDVAKALHAFEAAAAVCQDAELLDMLKDEVVECALLVKLHEELNMIAS